MKRIAEDQNDALAALIRSAGRRPVPPAEDYEQVLSAATTAWRAKVRVRRRNRWALAAAAGIAIVALTFIPLLPRAPGPMTTVATTGIVRGEVALLAPGASSWTDLSAGHGELRAGTALRSGADGRVTLTLATGVEVRVNGATEIRLAAADNLDLSAGIIYVDSGPLARPGSLRIGTRFGELRDIGTQFEASAAADALRVRVREGRVVLDQQGLRLESAAGQQLTIDDAGQAIRTAFPTDDPGWRWAESLAAVPDIEGRSVSEFLNWVARETGRRLEYEAPGTELRARTVMLHATVSLSDLTPIEALDTVLATTNFDYIIQDDGAILVRRR